MAFIRRRGATIEEMVEVMNLWEEGKTDSDIARALSRPQSTVSRWLRQMGCQPNGSTRQVFEMARARRGGRPLMRPAVQEIEGLRETVEEVRRTQEGPDEVPAYVRAFQGGPAPWETEEGQKKLMETFRQVREERKALTEQEEEQEQEPENMSPAPEPEPKEMRSTKELARIAEEKGEEHRKRERQEKLEEEERERERARLERLEVRRKVREELKEIEAERKALKAVEELEQSKRNE